MTGEQRATLAGVVNGLLVFIVPIGMLGYGYASADLPLSDGPRGLVPFLLWNGRSAVTLALLGIVTSWRTHVHFARYVAGASSGWEGVAEATAGGVLTAASYTVPPLFETSAFDLRPLVVYCGVGLVIGGFLGVFLRAVALAIAEKDLRHNQTSSD